jgi:DNA adenine methylase
MQPRPRTLIEPFCGGDIVALTAVCESLVEQCFMAELDHDVAAFWHVALRHSDELCHLVSEFEPTRESVSALADQAPRGLLEHGFRTLVLNRTRRGGILAPGAALTKSGENNKGLASRWYPETIIHRLRNIEAHAAQINFCEADGLDLLEVIAEVPGTVAFIDPPYTAGGKRAGRRLYSHSQIDHRRLFKILAQSSVDFLMTYDRSPEIAELIAEYGFHAVEVVMKNTHHAQISELIITRQAAFK